MKMERLELTAAPGDSGRLDAWLAGQCPTLSRSALQNLIEQGLVTCGGAPVNKKDKVAPGKVYAIDLPDPQPIEARPQNIPLDIVYEDDDLLVVNKPKGMVVHPAPGNPDGTLVNALLYHCAGQLSGIGGAIRPGIVHRIDKDTSGLLVVAKNDAAHQALRQHLRFPAARARGDEHRASARGYGRALRRRRSEFSHCRFPPLLPACSTPCPVSAARDSGSFRRSRRRQSGRRQNNRS